MDAPHRTPPHRDAWCRVRERPHDGPVGGSGQVALDLGGDLELVPVVLPTEESPLSLNLKGPIVFSRAARIGLQRISSDDRHTVRHIPQPFGSGAPSCSS